MGVSLTRTAGTPTSKKKFTFSLWYKKPMVRDHGSTTSDMCFFNSAASNDNRLTFYINQENSPYDQLRLTGRNGGSSVLDLRTTTELEDIASWYHIVAKVDTTQSTNTNRAKLYINGVEQPLDTNSYPNQDVELEIQHTPYLLSYSGSGNYVEGTVSHFHYCDGYAYDASSFGEFNATSGIWTPKTAPSVTYGTNGFFLKFDNSGAMGTDSSGQSNTLAVSGTFLQVQDTPTNLFATLNNLDCSSMAENATFSHNNLTVQAAGSNYRPFGSTIGVNKGKWYAEFKTNTANNDNVVGIFSNYGTANGDWTGKTAHNYAWYNTTVSGDAGNLWSNNARVQNAIGTYTTNDIISVAIDCDNNKLYLAKNGTYVSSQNPSTGANGFTITDPFETPAGCYFFCALDWGGTRTLWNCNFGLGYFGTSAVASANADANGHGAMEYAVPTGFYTLCTKNLKEFG